MYTLHLNGLLKVGHPDGIFGNVWSLIVFCKALYCLYQ
jgi:hypothetical protein